MPASRKIAALPFVLCLAALPLGRAQLFTGQKMRLDLTVTVRADISGDIAISAWSRNAGRELIPVLPEIVHCPGAAKPDRAEPNMILCPRALRRNGLALEGAIDLAPIARSLDASTGVQLWLNLPRVGFQSPSPAMTEEEGTAERVSRSMSFEAGSAPPPIPIRFGYRRDQLSGIYLPLAALALALTLITAIMARAGLAALSRTAVMLGTIVWMGAAAQLQADGPLNILLHATPFANFAALLVEFWPPLFCVALGVAFGSKLRAGQPQNRKAGEILGTYAVIPLLLTCAVGALSPMTNGDWFVAVLWLAAAPAILLLRRAWIRAGIRSGTRSRVVLVTSGEFKDRVSALAARAGCPQVKVYISFSARSEISNAFALPGKSIFLTAPLVRSFSKREVDAVAAHELSHFHHSYRGIFTALCLAMVMCATPARDLVRSLPGGLFTAMLVPIAVFLASLRGMRKREFAADAGAAALTQDPRAMISSLARIARCHGLLHMNAMAEWFSSHPSTRRRIWALAAAAGLDPAEVESLCAADDLSGSYELPQEPVGGGPVFTLAWQLANAKLYGWVVLLGSCAAGLFTAWLLDRLTGTAFGGYGAIQIAAAIALGCLIVKGLAATAMAGNFARLRRRIETKLGIDGELVGLAMESEPRLYSGFRFSDAGLLRFEGGRLCYRSERIAIALNPADVVEVGMVSASPSNWARLQPMVRFRQPGSGSIQAFILHPVGWVPTQRRLLNSIERWKAAQGSIESTPLPTAISGFNPVAGQPFTNPTILEAARGFRVPGALTLVGAILIRTTLQADWSLIGCAVAVCACSYLFMFLPAMLYRLPALSSGLTAPADAS